MYDIPIYSIYMYLKSKVLEYVFHSYKSFTEVRVIDFFP